MACQADIQSDASGPLVGRARALFQKGSGVEDEAGEGEGERREGCEAESCRSKMLREWKNRP